MRFTLISILFTLLSIPVVMSQERCGTVAYMKQLVQRRQFPQDRQLFENWLKEKMLKAKTSQNERSHAGPYQIPVVVHIIHRGEPVGTGTNIPDSQVLSQISVLNEDFNRTNPDAASTPAVFSAVAGSMDIEFVLAKQDPEGLATNGIVRVRGSKDGWVANDNYELKSQSYWPSEDYLNIWVCDLVDDLVGYAQLPESSLPGLENASMNPFTDGVVIWYRAFGSIDDGNFSLSSNFNKGRTATHEIGHFLGLNHIWGDDEGGCSGTDNVDDTPNQSGFSTGCPSHPKTTCNVVNMFQNFMDYTNDACMNLYTNGQVARMTTVIENSPRRVSLLTSPGLQLPGQNAVDAGVKEIVNIAQFLCASQIQPVVRVRNYGTNTVTSVKIDFLIDGAVVETKTFSVNLPALAETDLTFSATNVPGGNHNIDFEIIETNGVADNNISNNVASENIVIPVTISPPFTETFNAFPAGWTISNPDGLETWQIVTAPRDVPTNKAMYMDLYNYDESTGEVDILYSPLIDVEGLTIAALEFFVSHARYPNSTDRLRIVVLENCEDISTGTVVYEKGSSELATMTQSFSDAFFPSDAGDWRREFVDLTSFAGSGKIQLAFVSISDWGNNIFIDNIAFVTTAFEDVAIAALESPSIVTCNQNPEGLLRIENVGTSLITSVDLQVEVGSSTQNLQFTGLNFDRGEAALLEFPLPLLANGSNTITLTLQNPNGQSDPTLQNNIQSFKVVVNQEEDRIPLRQNFEEDFSTSWTIVNPEDANNWQTTETQTPEFGTSIYYNSFSDSEIGNESWLVSPVLDFSGTTKASMVFDISQRTRLDQEEALRIMASKDCGDTYYELRTIDIDPAANDDGPWEPGAATDWFTNFVVDLDDLAGETDVRIAFVVTNQNGNNLYLDNIEFFTSNPPNLIVLAESFSIYGYNATNPVATSLQISFNLNSRQDVEFTIVDMMGRQHASGILRDVLNQTYPLDFASKPQRGVYLVRITYSGKSYVQKILIDG